jgi:hypothetical protein
MYAEGNYTCRITAQDVTTTKTGSFQLDLEILPIKADDQPIDGNVFRRHLYLPLTEATLGTPESPGWVAETLERLGFEGRNYEQLNPENEDAQSFINKEVNCYVKHEEYNDQPRERWSLSKAKPKAQKPPKGALAALGGVSTAGPATKPQDIPF